MSVSVVANTCQETPPRAWGRQTSFSFSRCMIRNTPTGVGTTGWRRVSASNRKKHPHGRGDDFIVVFVIVVYIETPPRAWGRRAAGDPARDRGGNTPTGVGTTRKLLPTQRGTKKHPHGRGDDPKAGHGKSSRSETPPRAWGRPKNAMAADAARGNTPTGVGTTYGPRPRRMLAQKHPHGRGDDTNGACLKSRRIETPPRAWGRLPAIAVPEAPARNTPTGVGTTYGANHRCAKQGNTPTGVGTTEFVARPDPADQKHPHGRGDDHK